MATETETAFECKYRNGGMLNGAKCSILTHHTHCSYRMSGHIICNKAIVKGEFHEHCGFQNFDDYGDRLRSCDFVFTSEDRGLHVHCTHKEKSYMDTMCGKFTHTHEHCTGFDCNHTFETLFICPPAGTSKRVIENQRFNYETEKALHRHCPTEECPFVCEEYHTEGEVCEDCQSHTHCSECNTLKPHTHCDYKDKNGRKCGDIADRYHVHCDGCDDLYDDGFCHNCN